MHRLAAGTGGMGRLIRRKMERPMLWSVPVVAIILMPGALCLSGHQFVSSSSPGMQGSAQQVMLGPSFGCTREATE